jgi:hypothetical protein
MSRAISDLKSSTHLLEDQNGSSRDGRAESRQVPLSPPGASFIVARKLHDSHVDSKLARTSRSSSSPLTLPEVTPLAGAPEPSILRLPIRRAWTLKWLCNSQNPVSYKIR